MAGLAVEAIEDLAAPLQGIVVGRVKRLNRIQPAQAALGRDRLGAGPRTLVTGAKNLTAGDLVPVAPDGDIPARGEAD